MLATHCTRVCKFLTAMGASGDAKGAQRRWFNQFGARATGSVFTPNLELRSPLGQGNPLEGSRDFQKSFRGTRGKSKRDANHCMPICPSPNYTPLPAFARIGMALVSEEDLPAGTSGRFCNTVMRQFWTSAFHADAVTKRRVRSTRHRHQTELRNLPALDPCPLFFCALPQLLTKQADRSKKTDDDTSNRSLVQSWKINPYPIRARKLRCKRNRSLAW